MLLLMVLASALVADPIVPPDAKFEKLWDQGEFTEGPALAPDGSIYFSDIGNRILQWNPKSGNTTVYRAASGRANGLKFDAEGRLLACEGANTEGKRRITRTEPDGTISVVAEAWDGKRFNSPNDLAIDRQGRIWFTDPRYVGTETREIDRENVYRIDPDGKVTAVITDIIKPNGIAFAPDEKTLYVASTTGKKGEPQTVRAYPVNADGSLGAGKVLIDFGAMRGCDGLAVSAEGFILTTIGDASNGGIGIYDPTGKQVAFVRTPEEPSNLCFGKEPGTLFVTAGKSLYRVRIHLKAPPSLFAK